MLRHWICFGCIAAVLCTMASGEDAVRVPVSELGRKYKLTGKLHVPLGECLTIEGIVREGPFKGYDGGPNLIVQRIGGVATQEYIRIPLRPQFGWGTALTGEPLPVPALGKTLQMEGFEQGGYIGLPREAYDHGAVPAQTAAFYFRTEFLVLREKAIAPIRFSPADFGGRKALLGGIAKTDNGRSVMVGNGWDVIINGHQPWPNDIEEKAVESYGTYRSIAAGHFALADGSWHLVRLEDQAGRDVTLRGIALSLNGVWWFNYRGVDLYVEDMEKLPGWTHENHARPMVIRGRLEKAMLPRLDQISLKKDRDLREYFVVRKASWEPVEELLTPELPPGVSW